MKSLIGIFLIFISLGFAQTFEYPTKKPVFSITFPSGWSVESDDDSLIAISKDESIEVDLWPLDKKKIRRDSEKALSEALDEIDNIINDWVDDFEVTSTKEDSINEIDFFEITGFGIDKDSGEEIEVSINLLTPDKKNIFVMLWWGSKEAQEKNLSDLISIVFSMKKP
jgi:hypothetical protein